MNLYIPNGIRRGKEFTEGYGKKEMEKSVKAFLFFLPFWGVVAVAYGLTYITGMFFILSVIASISLCMKGKYNFSAFDSMQNLIVYMTGQKYYPYSGCRKEKK